MIWLKELQRSRGVEKNFWQLEELSAKNENQAALGSSVSIKQPAPWGPQRALRA
jgi:hypothetical protein